MSQLERFILAPNKLEALKEITPYTSAFHFLEILIEFETPTRSEAQLDTLVEKFLTSSHSVGSQVEVVKLKHRLRKISLHKDSPDELRKWLDRLNKEFLSLNFDFPNTGSRNPQGELQGREEEVATKSALSTEDLQKLTLDDQLQTLYRTKRREDLNKLDRRFYDKLDLSKFDLVSDKVLIDQILPSLNLPSYPGVVDFLLGYRKQYPQETLIRNSLWSGLTLSQKASLLVKEPAFGLDDNLQVEFVRQKFELEKTKDKSRPASDRLAEWQRLRDHFLAMPQKFRKYAAAALLKMFELKAEMGEFDEQLFFEYLKSPYRPRITGLEKPAKVEKTKARNYQDNADDFDQADQDLHGFIVDTDLSKLVKEYLPELFAKAPSMVPYLEFFEEAPLKPSFYAAKLLRGQPVDNLTDIFSPNQLQSLHAQRSLKLIRNPERFATGEKVSLKVELKNIQRLNIRVFEVNTLNFLREKNSAAFEGIDLAGLLPSEEYAFSYALPPLTMHREDFEFPNITSRNKGVFIVDFIGDELNSRAVIYKGALTLVNDAQTGRNCVLVDEDDQICVGPETGFFVGNTFLAADAATGIIGVPLNIASFSNKVVAVHNGFACLCPLNIRDPQPQLDINVLYNSESLLPGNQVELVVQAKLTMNGQPASLAKLNDGTVLIATTSLEGLKYQNTFKDLKFRDSEDTIVSFIFPQKVKSLVVGLAASLAVAGETKNLAASQRLELSDGLEARIENGYFRKNAAGELLFEVLGRNGEPIPKTRLQATISLQFDTTQRTFELFTDAEGRVNLGKVEFLNSVTISGSFGQLTHTLRDEAAEIYPQALQVVEDEEIELPAPAATASETPKIVLLQYTTEGGVKEVLTKKNLVITGEVFKIKGLKEGAYGLLIGRNETRITVHKGEYLQLNGPNIRTKTALIPVPKSERLFVPRLSARDGQKLSVAVDGATENTRAHLLLFNYVPGELDILKQQIRVFGQLYENQLTRDTFAIEQRNNVYRSDKRLNDELIYAYDRRGKPNYLGNTLEKPGILLKRNRLGETTETAPKVNAGSDFANLDEASRQSQQNYAQQRYRNAAYDQAYPGPGGSQEGLLRVLAFLKTPGKVMANLTRTADGALEIGRELLGQYSFALLVLTNGNLTAALELPCSAEGVEKADCRLAQSKTPGFIYEHERRMFGALKDQSTTVRNIKNTALCIFDSLPNLFEILQLLQREGAADLKQWDFLKKWSNLEPMEKLKKYDKFASHELNLFLFNKDREFFDAVVGPLLANKREKQLIDFYLLQDSAKLEQFCDFSAFTRLNKLELSLLAQAAAKFNPQFSASVLKYLKSASVLQKKPEKERNLIFDSLLSSQEDKSRNETASAPPTNRSMPRPVPLGNSSGPMAMMERSSGAMNKIAMLSSSRIQENATLRSARQEYGEINLEKELELKTNVEIFMPSQGTIEYNERQYWKQTLTSVIEPFWSELAEHLAARQTAGNFLPETLIYSARNFSDCLLALCFVDLPFEKVRSESSVAGEDLRLQAATNLLLLTKEVIQREGERTDFNVLCAQRFFDPSDRFVYDEEDPGLKVDKAVREFVAGKVYGSRVVVTNSTSSDLGVSVAFEIPQGAIAVGAADAFQMHGRLLGSLQSEVFEFQFYFPRPGPAALYPATVARGSRIIASAPTVPPLEVRATASAGGLETIGDVLSLGNTGDVLDFVQNRNVLNPNVFAFRSIYWLLKNRAFYQRLVEILRAKGICEETVLSFSLFHADLPTLREFLRLRAHRGGFGATAFLDSELLRLDRFEAREYFPLINPRAYSLGAEKVNIINDAFKATYLRFLHYLLQKGAPAAEDWLQLASYLLAQDRFEEAAQLFGRVASAQSAPATRIQRDYVCAYIDFVRGYPEFREARRLCEEYLVHPALSWRNLFVEMANQLAEFEEAAQLEALADRDKKAASNADKAARAPFFAATLEDGVIRITSQHATALKVSFFKVDLEILFTLNPFALEAYKNFGHVQPFLREKVALRPEGDAPLLLPIPEALRGENLFVQLSLGEKGVAQEVFLGHTPFRLQHHLNTDFGILKLVDGASRKPVPKVYVKCFVRYKSGQTAFYKDGYTDLRGSFDYVSLSKDNLSEVDRFSLMVSGGEFGFKVLQATPPKSIGRVEGEAKQLVSANWANIQQQCTNKEGISKYAKLI